MFLLPLFQQAFVLSFLFAASVRTISDKKKRPTTWLIDGNNFLGQKGTPRDGDVLAERLQPITTEAAQQVVLVFDGRSGQLDRQEQKTGHDGKSMFRQVQLKEGEIADDFILETIREIHEDNKMNRVKLVTADKRLRAAALSTRPTVKSVVNPKVFWKKYLPRMSGQKKRHEQSVEEGEE
ncbi:MAG: hypothetical protein SGARI_007121 [Bacillariaceae sp.]